MFGYVMPLKGELRVRELEEYRAVYCGLCRMLKERCGFAASFVLSYDYTFLAMLMSRGEEPEYEDRRCASSPLTRRSVLVSGAELEIAADHSVILGWYKLGDSIADEGFWGAMGARIARLILRRAYGRARRARPRFDKSVNSLMSELNELERGGCAVLDAVADKFALILAAVADDAPDERTARVLRQVLYHTGRWIYIIDAVQDMREDLERGEYNAVAARFPGAADGLEGDDLESLEITLNNSLGMAATALELLPEGHWTAILRNIVYLGMAAVQRQVLEGGYMAQDKV